MLLHCNQKIKRANVKLNSTNVFLGICTYTVNTAIFFVYNYFVYLLAQTNKMINYILLFGICIIGGGFLNYAMYISLIPQEWQEEIIKCVKYEILGCVIFIFGVFVL